MFIIVFIIKFICLILPSLTHRLQSILFIIMEQEELEEGEQNIGSLLSWALNSRSHSSDLVRQTQGAWHSEEVWAEYRLSMWYWISCSLDTRYREGNIDVRINESLIKFISKDCRVGSRDLGKSPKWSTCDSWNQHQCWQVPLLHFDWQSAQGLLATFQGIQP